MERAMCLHSVSGEEGVTTVVWSTRVPMVNPILSTAALSCQPQPYPANPRLAPINPKV